jgi:chromosome segregation protein
LLELLEVAPEHRPAVEAALEGQLEAWVACDAEALGHAAATVCAAQQRETILHAHSPAASAAGPAELPPGLTAILSLVRAPDLYQELLGALIGDAVLCADREQAFLMATTHPHFRFVTADGEVVTAWSYRGGRGERAALDLQAQLKAAESRLRELAGRLDQLRSRQAAVRARHAEAVSLRTEAGFDVERARTRRAELAAALISVRGGAERDATDQRALEQQQARLNALFEAATASRSSARHRLERALETAENLDLEAPRTLTEIEACARDLEVALAQRQAAELQLALAEQRQLDLGAQLERAVQARGLQAEELQRRREAAEALTREPEEVEAERERTLAEVARLEGRLSGLEDAPLPGAETLAELEAAVREDEERNVKLQVELAHTEDALTAAGVEVHAASEEVDRCAAALHDEAHPLEEQDAADDVDWQRTEREVSRLTKKLESMGAVNLLAPDEYAQISDRCASLAGQLLDLENAVEHLTSLRQQLEASIDERFRTVFQSVAVNFQEFFHELFEGGRATLRLDDEVEDPLDRGVEILAQTPGKRLLQLTLLSGGERALTALAFLFALQAVNPSPFYVLDEVDAALDDANVVRFNRVLKRLSREQQFVVVTHNHSTMAQAAALFGVTLGEHGISRIVSVRLEQGEPHYAAVGERTA